MIEGADVVTLSWREDMEQIGWKGEKARFEGPHEVAQLLSRLEFTSDQPSREVAPVPAGWVLTQARCLCDGTHVMRAFRGETMIAEISIHHATHLRSKQINGGFDTYLTKESAAWLNTTIGWDQEVVPAMEAAMKRQAASSANNRDGN